MTLFLATQVKTHGICIVVHCVGLHCTICWGVIHNPPPAHRTVALLCVVTRHDVDACILTCVATMNECKAALNVKNIYIYLFYILSKESSQQTFKTVGVAECKKKMLNLDLKIHTRVKCDPNWNSKDGAIQFITFVGSDYCHFVSCVECVASAPGIVTSKFVLGWAPSTFHWNSFMLKY